MTDISDDLVPGAPDDLLALGRRLQAERPVPAPAFRGQLRRHLEAHATPRGLRARIATFAASGSALMAFAAVSAVGAGPLGG